MLNNARIAVVNRHSHHSVWCVDWTEWIEGDGRVSHNVIMVLNWPAKNCALDLDPAERTPVDRFVQTSFTCHVVLFLCVKFGCLVNQEWNFLNCNNVRKLNAGNPELFPKVVQFLNQKNIWTFALLSYFSFSVNGGRDIEQHDLK